MKGQEIEYFLHAPGAKPRVGMASRTDVLCDVLARLEGLQNGADKVFVFVGECDEALKEPDETDNGADEHEPANIGLTFEALDVHHHRHIHVHRCRHIAVEVNFGGKTKRHRFSPAATVGTATEWARRKFRLDPAAAAEYVLQVCGTTNQPRSDEHLGELVKEEACALCFDLVKEVTPQG